MHLVLISASFLTVIAIYTAESADPVCSKPPDITFASLTEESDEPYSIGATVTYGCQFGYVISGDSRNLKCIRSGRNAVWTEPEFICLPRSCGDPGMVTNGRRVGLRFTFPNSVSYYCDEGYKMRGIATRYCQASGTWSGGLPVCQVITCDPPKNIENGHAIALSFEYGSELEYKCDKGFRLNTDETIYCTEEGIWSKTDVACIETTCEVPEAPEFGHVYFRGTEERPRAGSIAVFNCDEGKIADGPTTSKCLDTGIWTFSPPKCIGERVEDYEEFVIRCINGFEVADSGHQEVQIICAKGKWTPDPICNPAPCRSTAPFAANAEVVDVNRIHGGTVSYKCLPDYKKRTTETVICVNGVWRGEPPSCESTKCSVNTLTSPGLQKGYKRFYRDGEVFEVTCNQNYQLDTGNIGRIMCKEGTWTGDLSPCVPANCSDLPPSIEFGRVKYPFSMAHGSTVRYACEDPYILVRESLVQCAFGKWTGKPPQCQDSRCYLTHLKNKDHVSTRSQTVTFSGERLKIICDEGCSPKSKMMPLCLNGSWQSDYEALCEDNGELMVTSTATSILNMRTTEPEVVTSPTSQEPSTKECFCEYLVKDNNIVAHADGRRLIYGDRVRKGSRVLFHCLHDHHRFRGHREFACNGCQSWDASDFPSCVPPKIDGCEIPEISRGSLREERLGDWKWEWKSLKKTRKVNHIMIQTGSIVSSGTELWFYCDEPYSVQGYGRYRVKTRCLGGKWSTELQCLLGDCEIPKIARGSLIEERHGDWQWSWTILDWERTLDYITIRSGSTVSSGTVLWFYCKEPYSVHGSGRYIVPTMCLGGKWSTELQCLLDGEIMVTSTATSILNRRTTVPELHSSSFSIMDEYLPTSTTTKAEEWTSSIDINESKPGEVVTSPTSQEPPAKECFCEYPVKDNNIVAHVDDRRLIYGGRVRNGSTALFHCVHVGYHRFKGHREITCNDCQSWDISDFPFCVPPKKGDAAILFNRDINVLPDGNIEIHKGQSANFTCFAMEIAQFPKWSAPESLGILTISERRERKDYGDVVYLTHLEIQNADYENEGTYECYTDDSHKTMLQVVITVPDCMVEDLLSSLPHNVVPLVDSKTYSSLPYNITVKLACTGDMVAVGNPGAKCDKEAKWEIDTVQCAYGCQPPIKIPSSKLLLIPEAEFYKIGENVTLSCPPGMILNTESEEIMCMNSGWSDPDLPDCKVKDNYTSDDKSRT